MTEERPIIRCYECRYWKKRGNSRIGFCKEIKRKTEAADWCYKDEVEMLKE